MQMLIYLPDAFHLSPVLWAAVVLSVGLFALFFGLRRRLYKTVVLITATLLASDVIVHQIGNQLYDSQFTSPTPLYDWARNVELILSFIVLPLLVIGTFVGLCEILYWFRVKL